MTRAEPRRGMGLGSEAWVALAPSSDSPGQGRSHWALVGVRSLDSCPPNAGRQRLTTGVPLARGPLSVWGLPERDVKQSRWRTAQVEWGRVGGVRETGQVRRSLGGGSLGWRSPRALEGVRKQFAPFPPFEYGRRPGCRPAVGKRRCAEGRRLPVSSQSPLSQNGLSLGRPALGLFSAPPSAAADGAEMAT